MMGNLKFIDEEEEKEKKKVADIWRKICRRAEINGRNDIIKFYAEHYHQPLSDFRGFNKLIKEKFGFKTTKAKLHKILGY
jgi:hypothetical protein